MSFPFTPYTHNSTPARQIAQPYPVTPEGRELARISSRNSTESPTSPQTPFSASGHSPPGPQQGLSNENLPPQAARATAHFTGPESVQYISYSGPTPRNIPPFRSHNTIDGGQRYALSTPDNIDKLVDRHKVSAHREEAHRYSEYSVHEQMVYLFIYVLVLLQSNQQISADLAAVKSSLVRMQNLAESNWKLSKPQQAMLKSIVRHTLIIPRGTYGDIAEAAAAHVKAQAGTINLTQYITDPTVRIVVDGFLVRQVNEFRSNLRKSLFSAVKDKKPLRKLARELVDAYHLPTVPDIIPNNILATLALMREVAAPLVGQSNVRDTKFWKNLEVALDDLYGKEQNGEDRQSLAWKQWETNIIHKDEETYRARSAASVPATRQEIMQNTEQLTDVEDRDVHMSELGDFAAVLAGASQ